jgi:monofunctional biosynthetic peptidoglycan transglycosylase
MERMSADEPDRDAPFGEPPRRVDREEGADFADFGEPAQPSEPPYADYEDVSQQRQDAYDPAPPSEPYIPMPGEYAPRGDFHARDAQRNLDHDLGRIKRRKRYGFALTTLSVIFVAFFIVPVTWVGAYLFIDAPADALMLQRAAEGETIRHQPVSIRRMSPHIIRSVIAAEDANFCTHHGFDVEAIQDAMESNAGGGNVRGASTISQQTAKNLFLWPQRSWLRKGLETYFTALIEFIWPKRRIMEHYLNVAEWGDGIFGVQAAAQARFGVDAEDLTPLQAARLAAVLPSPNSWRADNPGPYVRRRSASIVQRAQVVRNERMAACVLALDRSGS